MGKKILVVDDDSHILELVKAYLEKEGFEVFTTSSGQQILSLTQEVEPDLIILDVMLPDIDGFEVCVELRKITQVPIFFLSGKTAEIDKVVGLSIGADDYIEKPFSPRELVARIKIHLRRYSGSNQNNFQTKLENQVLKFPGLTIDLSSHFVQVNDKPVSLSNKEFALLAQLAKNPNRIFRVEELFELIWGENSYGDVRTVMVHISNLRKKIEPDPAKPTYVITVRGIGYKFNDAPNPDTTSSSTVSMTTM